MYDHLQRGWMAICVLSVGMVGLSVILSICYTGDRPLIKRLLKARHGSSADVETS